MSFKENLPCSRPALGLLRPLGRSTSPPIGLEGPWGRDLDHGLALLVVVALVLLSEQGLAAVHPAGFAAEGAGGGGEDDSDEEEGGHDDDDDDLRHGEGRGCGAHGGRQPWSLIWRQT